MRLYKQVYRAADGSKRTSKVWRVRFNICAVRHDESTGMRDRNAASAAAARIIKDAELKVCGIDTHRDTRDADLKTLVVDYERELLRRGKTKAHADLTGARIRALVGDLAGLTACTPERLRLALERLAHRAKRTPTARTINAHRIALNGFFRWLLREGRWHENPVAATSPVAAGEPTVRRRALSADEVDALLAAAPPERAIVYRFAVTTGLRRKEIASLAWDGVDLEAGTVLCRASTTKNKREAQLPLVAGTVAALAAWRESRGATLPTAPLFPHVPDMDEMRADLAAAGIEYENAQGKVDFHALRGTFVTMLCRADVPLAMAQRLARHCTPTLTARHYVRLELSDLTAAAARLPDLGAPADKKRRRKTS